MESMIKVATALLPFYGKCVELALWIPFFGEGLREAKTISEILIREGGVSIYWAEGGRFLFNTDSRWTVEQEGEKTIFAIYSEGGQGKDRGVESMATITPVE